MTHRRVTVRREHAKGADEQREVAGEANPQTD